ncbi:hypothetical protein KY331_02005 [Candidatus Woesearchaeota archaeon]|nr:hypothetical protein [Candidatus Woesearchaeota archaeon]
MSKKTIFIIAILLILTGAIIFLVRYQPPQIGSEYFAEQPETWIEDRYETPETDDVEIDIYKATRGKNIADVGQQDYYTQGDIISFFYTGFYKGNSFSNLYAGDEEKLINMTRNKPIQEQIKIVEENAIMRIDSKLNPYDGVIDSFILAREEDQRFVFYIFLDEDWKNKVKYTNILWGDNLQNKNAMHLKPFDFSKSENGIYINKIDVDVDWNNLNPISGGMMVGEVDHAVLARLIAYEEFTETFIYIR